MSNSDSMSRHVGMTEDDMKQIDGLFNEITSICQQIGHLSESIAAGALTTDAVESIKLLSNLAGMYADMGVQKFGPGCVGGVNEWVMPMTLRSLNHD